MAARAEQEVSPGQEGLWRAAVATVLRGADFDRALVSRSRDNIPVGPLYPTSNMPAAALWRDTARPFAILQRADHFDLLEANRLARVDLASGAHGLALVFAGAPGDRGFGLWVETPDDLAALFQGVDLDAAVLRCDLPSVGGEGLALMLAEFLKHQGHPVAVDFGLDPLGPGADADQLFPLRGSVAALRDRGYAAGLVRADGRPSHQAGASEAQELAAVLAAGVAALRALEGDGLAAARDALSFALTADADPFLTIAKFRAMRLLWTRVEAACGLDARPIRLHAETACRMLSRRDPDTNILRNTIAATAAILSGADSLTVLPHSSAGELPDAFARRLARNTLLVLLEESNLGRVADPASGAGSFEALTEALCREAWGLFQGLEREGGLARALAAGSWQAQIACVRHARHEDYAAGRASIVGVTAFVTGGAALADGGPVGEGSAGAWTRDAEPFEPPRNAGAVEAAP